VSDIARNRDFVLGLGADEYLDYTQQDIAAHQRAAAGRLGSRRKEKR
jgi:hypothetical protein